MLTFSADAVLDKHVGEVVEMASESGSGGVVGTYRNHRSEDHVRYCSDCNMWLNGLTQWEDHRIGAKHRKNVLLALAYEIAAASGL